MLVAKVVSFMVSKFKSISSSSTDWSFGSSFNSVPKQNKMDVTFLGIKVGKHYGNNLTTCRLAGGREGGVGWGGVRLRTS